MRVEEQVVESTPYKSGNLVQLLIDQARDPKKLAATEKRNGRWVDSTWAEILEQVKDLSSALVESGVRPGDRVAIFGAPSLRWLVCDLAISASQGITVPIYASNTPDECRYILNHAEVTLLFVDHDEADGKQMGRVSRIRRKIVECPSVHRVVIFEGKPASEKEVAYEEFVRPGDALALARSRFDARLATIKPEDPCCFIYTSGTTGDPKGVILSHRNWVYEAWTSSQIGVMEPGDSTLLFLPLAHSFAQVVKAAWLGMGFRMIFAESIDKLLQNLGETHPSILPAVPRVFEKVYNNVVANGTAAPGVKGKLFRWAMKLFDEYVEAREAGREYHSLSFALAKKLVFSKVRATLDEKLGGRIRLFVSGGAPLSRKIGYFFDLLGYQVCEGYGLTETSAATVVNRPGRARIGTVGQAVPMTELKIAADGEILIKGPGVMRGYYKNPAATAEAIEPDGWFHSGDIGELDADGYLRITDRKKDIIVTAGGKNVAPQNLENFLKTFPLISQAMIHGDRRKYLTAVICVSEESARKLPVETGAPVESYAQLIARPEIQTAVQKVIDQVNAEQPSYQTIKKFILADHEFSQETGELTPTLKVKRKICTTKYKSALDALYEREFAD